jgi:hypothetical protein
LFCVVLCCFVERCGECPPSSNLPKIQKCLPLSCVTLFCFEDLIHGLRGEE